MLRTCARLIAGVLLLGVCAFQAQAQTLERFAGGARHLNAPAHDTPVTAGEIALTPDGRLLVINQDGGHIYRYDPATQTVTLLPETTEFPNWPPPYSYFNDITVNGSGVVYAVQGRTIRTLLPNGHDEHFAGSSWGGANTQCSGYSSYPATFGSIDDIAALPSGQILVANGAEHRICIISPGGGSQTIAGSWSGYEGDGGPAYEARFNMPRSVATDAAGNVYVSDNGNSRIRKFSIDEFGIPGNIETIAGTGEQGYNGDDVPATSAQISDAVYLTVDGAGNVYFYDRGNARVRRVDGATGLITTVAGNGEWGFSGDGGPATQAQLSDVWGLSIHPDGGLYISDGWSRRVRRVDLASGMIDSVFGNGTANFCGSGHRLQICMDMPQAVAVDAQGNLFYADLGNKLIRRIDAATGMVSTIAGKAGETNAEHGGDSGPATDATFGSGPWGVAVDAVGNLYIATGFDHRIRRVDAATGIITTIAGSGVGSTSGDGGPAAAATLEYPTKIVVAPNGDLYFADRDADRVRKIDAVTGIITTVAGNGLTTGPLGDGGPGPLASLSSPDSLAFDLNGNLLIADDGHARLRKLDLTTGIITTVAGNGTSGPAGDGGPATSASVGYPLTVAVDAANNIFVTTGYGLRRIDAVTGIINRADAGWGLYTPEGDSLQNPNDSVFGPDGSLYFGDDKLILRIPDLPQTPVDTTPPVITPVITGTLGNDGWYRSNVTVSWDVVDPESVAGPTCSAYYVTTDTAGVTFTCTLASAGGTSSRSVTIKRDTVAPTLTFGTATPAATSAGWHNTDVGLPFLVNDALSGVASSSSSSPLTITGEGANLTGSIVVTDVAGNSATIASPGVNIDRTPPTYVLALPAAGANYGAFSSHTVQFNCNDALSGIANCSGTLANGAALPTLTAGSRNFQLMVTDSAGNVAAASLGYGVAAMTFERWIDLRRSPTFNGITAGNLVPIRWRLLDGVGGVVSNPAAFQSLTVFNLGCAGIAVPFNLQAVGGAGLSHDAATGVFTYNWQTDAGSTGCRRVQLRFGNNSTNEIVFRFQ